MSMTDSGIHEEVLRDPRYPVHRIAGRLLPYLEVLVEQFHPEKVILFGSFAYGTPSEDSDVDLLVIKKIRTSRLKDKIAIRSAWWPLLRESSPLSFDLMLADPAESFRRAGDSNSLHAEILRRGLQLI